MSLPRASSAVLLLASLLVVAACAGAASTPAPTTAPTPTPTTAPTPTPTTAPTPTGQPSPEPSDATGDQSRVGGWTSIDPCALLPSETMATLLGTLAGEPVRSAADRGGSTCTWTTASGATLAMTTDDPERFGAMRAAASGAEDVPNLGSGAYISEAGGSTTLVVHGGSVVVTVETGLGRDTAVAAARALLGILEVV